MLKITQCMLFSALLCTSQSAFALDAPALSVSSSGLDISLSWTSVPNATGYILYYAPYPYEGEHSIGSAGMGTATNFSATLWDGAGFYVALTAYTSAIESEYSNIELIQTNSPTNESVNFSGTYTMTNTVDATNCGEGIYTYINIIYCTQSDNNISFSGADDDGDHFVITGTVGENSASASGSYQEDSGTTYLATDLIFSGESFSGSTAWTWSDGYSSCSGSDTVSAGQVACLGRLRGKLLRA